METWSDILRRLANEIDDDKRDMHLIVNELSELSIAMATQRGFEKGREETKRIMAEQLNAESMP